jgi:hypothetical protein
MDITRGLALRTGLSTHYSALRSSHVHAFALSSCRITNTAEIVPAGKANYCHVAAAKSSAVTQQVQVFCRVSLWDSALRSAAATQYVADDPHIAERDDPALKSREFVQIRSARADINLLGYVDVLHRRCQRTACQLILHIPYVRGTFQLVHVYSSIACCSDGEVPVTGSESLSPSPCSESSECHVFQLKATIKTIQVFWSLPKQQFANRIDSINAHYSSNGQIGLGWSSLLLWVPIPSGINKWDDSTEDVMGRVGPTLQKWSISLPPSLRLCSYHPRGGRFGTFAYTIWVCSGASDIRCDGNREMLASSRQNDRS